MKIRNLLTLSTLFAGIGAATAITAMPGCHLQCFELANGSQACCTNPVNGHCPESSQDTHGSQDGTCPGDNTHYNNSDDLCYCDEGYKWEDEADPNNDDCIPTDEEPTTSADPTGNDPTGDEPPTPTTGNPEPEPLPERPDPIDCAEDPDALFIEPGESCDPAFELEFSTNAAGKAIAEKNCQQSTHYVCIPDGGVTGEDNRATGKWTKSEAGDLDCILQGFAYSVGSYMEDGMVKQACGGEQP